MATLLKVLNNLADIKSAGGVALRVRTQDGFLQVAIFAADGQKRPLRLAGPSLISTNPTASSRRATRS